VSPEPRQSRPTLGRTTSFRSSTSGTTPRSPFHVALGNAKHWLLNSAFLDNLRFSELKHLMVAADKMQPKNVLIPLLTLHVYTSFPEPGSS